MKIKHNKQLQTSGFTLIEVMAAVTIMSIGLIGSLTAINYSLKNIASQEDRIIAAGLASEGIELARNLRDSNWLAGAAWDTNFGFSDVAPIINVTRLKFFCGGRKSENEHQGSSDWNKTIDNCPACKVYTYKLSTEADDNNFVCYSDMFNMYEESGIYERINPRTEFYRLTTATRTGPGADQIKIDVYVKWVNSNGVSAYLPTVSETLYNWK